MESDIPNAIRALIRMELVRPDPHVPLHGDEHIKEVVLANLDFVNIHALVFLDIVG